jgi:hypothetical protein
MDELLKQLKEKSLKHAEALAVDIAENLVPAALDEAAKAIPGQVDDMIIAALKPALIAAAMDLAKKVYAEPAV